MYLIAAGLILVFFNINVTIGGRAIDILPDFIGYLLIAGNAAKLKKDAYNFNRAGYFGIFMAVYSVAVRVFSPTGLLGLALSVTEIIAMLYLLKLLTDGVAELEDAVGTHLNGFILDRWRLAVEIAYIVSYICIVGEFFIEGTAFFGLLVAIAWFAVCVLFVIVFFRTARRYSLLMRELAKNQ